MEFSKNSFTKLKVKLLKTFFRQVHYPSLPKSGRKEKPALPLMYSWYCVHSLIPISIVLLYHRYQPICIFFGRDDCHLSISATAAQTFRVSLVWAKNSTSTNIPFFLILEYILMFEFETHDWCSCVAYHREIIVTSDLTWNKTRDKINFKDISKNLSNFPSE